MENKLTILNFEGDVLYITPSRTKNHYLMFDQWNEHIHGYSRGEIIDIFDGELTVTDSSGKIWDVSKEHHDAKPSMKKILEYLFK